MPTLSATLFSEPQARRAGLKIVTDPKKSKLWLINENNQSI